MRDADLASAGEVSAAAFGIEISEQPARERWRRRVGHLLATDPQGAFVAERAGRVIGVAQAMRRERLWCLSLLAVQPGVQSAGAGRGLLEAALRYGSGAEAGLIVSSNDPRALRLYALAGFSLQPTLTAYGALDRRALPRSGAGVRLCDAADLEELAPISREIRGAPHTSELLFAQGNGARMLRAGDRGFAVAEPGHGVWLLVARDEDAAAQLLWAALEIAGDCERTVRWISERQQWAIRVVVAAGLQLSAYGAICVRGEPGPLRPFLPSPPFG
jgi:GNAT superfamily N-acetyltransferase